MIWVIPVSHFYHYNSLIQVVSNIRTNKNIMKLYNRYNHIIFKILIFLVFISSVFYKLNTVNSFSLSSDEIFSVSWAKNFDYQCLLKGYCFDGGNPPLHFVLLKSWFSLFGASDFSARMLSIIFFSISFYFVYKISYKQLNFSKLNTLFSVLLFSWSSILSFYFIQARPYSLLIATSLAVFYSAHELIKNKKFDIKNYLIFYLFSIIGLYSHYSFIIYYIILFISLISISYKQKYLLKRLILIFLLPSLLFIRWSEFYVRTQFFPETSYAYQYSFWQLDMTWKRLNQWISILTNDLINISGHSTINTIISYLLFFPYQIYLFIIFLKSKNHIKKSASIFLILISTLYLFSPLHNYFYHPRYLVFIIPFFYLSLFFIQIKNKNKFLILFYSLILILFIRNKNSFIEIEDWKGLSNYLHNSNNENSTIISEESYIPLVINYYYDGPTRVGCIDNKKDSLDKCTIKQQEIKANSNFYYVTLNKQDYISSKIIEEFKNIGFIRQNTLQFSSVTAILFQKDEIK